MAASAAGVQKSLDKIRSQVETGAYYEAQQMYKTVYHRYRARKALQDSFEVLQQGAVQQLGSRQITCGIELANLLVAAYKTDKVEASPDTLRALQQIIEALPDLSSSSEPADAQAQVDECSRFVMAAIKWAHKQNAGVAVRAMHDQFAQWLFRCWGWAVLGKASMHFSRGADAQAYAAALQQCMAAATPVERDLFICRAVLQVLACSHADNKQQQLHHAQALFSCLQQQQSHDSSSSDLLIHFSQFLLQALQLQSQDLVELLLARYATALERDPSLPAYLEKVQQVYFNLRPANGGGLLGSLLKGLLEGDEEDDD